MQNKELWQRMTELLGVEETARRFRVWATGLIKKEHLKRAESYPDEFFAAQAGEILSDLNKRAGRRFSLTPECSKSIKAILARGYLVEDFCRVHEVKCSQWLNDEKMAGNLRPSTLYRPRHFDEYLAEWFALDRQRSELQKKRQASMKAMQESKSRTISTPMDTSEIDKLLSKPWYSFPTWAEFMRHTIKLPSAEALERYEMPDRLRRMRTAPMMLSNVVIGKSPQWAEDEYRQIKEGVKANG